MAIAGKAVDSSCGSTFRPMAATRRSRCGSGAMRACASCRDSISRANRPTAAIPVAAISASPWFQTRRPRRRHSTAWSLHCAEASMSRRRSLARFGFLPDAAREALRRRLRELAGAGLILVAVLLALPLATWSVADPSLSHATNAPVRNVLGLGGAIVADLLTQLLGLSALMLVLPIGIWGWRLASHRRLARERIRLGLWVLSIPLWAASAAALPRPSGWPLPAGLGGVIGDWTASVLLAGGNLPGIARAVAMLVAGSGALLCFAMVAGFGLHPQNQAAPEQHEEEERAFISIGSIAHGILSLQARLRRVLALSRTHRAPAAQEAIPLERRAEPRFEDALAASLQPQIKADSDEDRDEPSPRAPGRPGGTPRPQRRSMGGYVLPPLEVLAAPQARGPAVVSAEALAANATALEGVLGDFGVRGEIINTRPGPVVTLYELEPAPGIKSSRVIGLADDIARSMSALSARVAVVPGRNAIGVELPNPHREKVYLRELLAVKDGNDSVAKLPLCLGKNIGRESIIFDLARLPHLLIVCTTASGKSVAINTMILSLLYRLRPDQCRLILVDPT